MSNEQQKAGDGVIPVGGIEYQAVSDEMLRLMKQSSLSFGPDHIDSRNRGKPVTFTLPEGMTFVPAEKVTVGRDGKPRKPNDSLAKQPKHGPDGFRFDLDSAGGDEEEIPADPITSTADYERAFKGDGYDSFDFAYDEYGNPIGAIVPTAALERDREAEERAGQFAESFIRGLEKKIGSSIERADTSALHNDKPLLQRAREVFAPPKRRVIHDPDELI